MDSAYFDIAMSEAGPVAVAYQRSDGNFSSVLYKWDVTTPQAEPDWTLVLQDAIAQEIDVSDDGR
jgi:hypothetical protein